jgi:hypothetical protein
VCPESSNEVLSGCGGSSVSRSSRWRPAFILFALSIVCC